MYEDSQMTSNAQCLCSKCKFTARSARACRHTLSIADREKRHFATERERLLNVIITDFKGRSEKAWTIKAWKLANHPISIDPKEYIEYLESLRGGDTK